MYLWKKNLFVVYDPNRYFGFGPIPKLKPKLVDTFGQYRNQYRNHISKEKSSCHYLSVWDNEIAKLYTVEREIESHKN